MTNESIYKSSAGEKAVMDWYEASLADWQIPYETICVSTEYGNTFIIVSGKETASPLVLLHGAGSNSLMWTGDIVQYSRYYRVYAIDLLGEPGKSSHVRPAWQSSAYEAWLDEVLTALKISRPTIIGFSQGGWAALIFGIYKSHAVSSLILLSPAGVIPDKLSFVLRAVPLLCLGEWGVGKINRMVTGDQEIAEGVIQGMTLIMNHFKPRVGVLPIFSDEELQRLTMPVLLLTGERDEIRDGKKITARLMKLVPNLSNIMIPNGAHALTNTPAHILPYLEAQETRINAGSRRIGRSER